MRAAPRARGTDGAEVHRGGCSCGEHLTAASRLREPELAGRKSCVSASEAHRDRVYSVGMALQIRTGTGFRWRPTALHGEAGDLVRVIDDAGGTLALLANGSDCGFSAFWPPASRLVLDLFADAWRSTSGPMRDRLLGAFATARQHFAEQAPALVTPSADSPDELPCAVLLAVVTDGEMAHVAWIGGDVALVARDARLILQTTPHTLLEQLRRERPLLGLNPVPNVIGRVIDSGRPDVDLPPDYLATEVTAGDTIVLLSRAPFRGPCVPVEDVAAATARTRTPSALAEQLADIGFVNSEAPYSAVAALRLEALP